MKIQRTRCQKGAVAACCLVLAIIFVVLVIGGVIFYFAVWKVPDYAKETEAVMIRVENDMATRSAVKDEDNAWTYYSKAVDSLDLSSLQSSGSTPGTPPVRHHGYYPQISEINKYLSNPPSGEQLKELEKIYRKNKKVYEYTGKAFEKSRFYNDPPAVNLSPQNQAQYAKHMENEMKVQALGYFLLLSGEVARNQGLDTAGAKYLMQGIYLDQNYSGRFLGIMSSMPESYSVKAWKSLLAVASAKDRKPELYLYILKNKDRLKSNSVIEMLEKGLYQNEKIMDGVKQTPGAQTVAFVIERERKVARGFTLKLIDEAAKDPVKFADGLENRKPDKISFYSTLLPMVTSSSVKNLFMRKVYYGGVVIACGLNLFKADRKEFPKSLDELLPKYVDELPLDPYSDKGTFIYKNDGKKAILYSVGPNHNDDGGSKDDIMLMDSSKTEKDPNKPTTGKTGAEKVKTPRP